MGSDAPSMKIPQLLPFDPSDWNAIHTAFEQAPFLDFGQAWLEKPAADFRPGRIQLGWKDDTFLFLASFVDDCLFTQMTADNQEAWNLGDVFELFLKIPAHEDYFEFHLTPNGHRLQLHFPDANAIIRIRDKLCDHKPFLINDALFNYAVHSVSKGWEVFVQLPASSLRSKVTSLQDTQVLASFSRYDYDDKGSPPVTSSTSLHKVAGFHRQEEWTLLTFTT